MRIRRLTIISVAVVVLVGAVGATVFYWRLESAKSTANLESAPSENVWSALSCRAGEYLQKAEGEVPELSWTELWGLTLPGRGFNCSEGGGLVASIRFTTNASEDDRKAGARIFHERCSTCHGADGSGGPFAPSLTRSQYTHGDSDLAIYEILRDGIPGTGMQSAGLTLLERLQVTSHLRELQNRYTAPSGWITVEHQTNMAKALDQQSAL